MRDILTGSKVETALTELRQKKQALQAQLRDAPDTSYGASVSGGGAVTQGSGATAVGERGVNVGGNVSGPIITGDSSTVTDVGGDLTRGDKVRDISGSSNIAIGHGAQVQQGVTGTELAAIFQKAYQQIEARFPDPSIDKEEIIETVQKIEQETAVSEALNESKLAR